MTIPARACRWLAALGALGSAGLGVGLAVGGVEAGAVIWVVGFVLPLYAIGLFAFRKRPDLPMARLLLAAGSCLLLAEGLACVLDAIHEGEGALSGLVPAAGFVQALHVAGVVLAAGALALFPDGRTRRPYERHALRAMLLLSPATLLQLLTSPRLPVVTEASGADEEAANPLAIGALSPLDGPLDALAHAYGLAFVAAIVLLALRYRRLDQVERLQVRWLLIVAVSGLLLAQALWALADSGGAAFETAGTVVAFLTLLALPATVLLAILRYRLLEVDMLIRKSLVYGALWVLIAVAYVGSAAALGIAAGERLPVALAVCLTVLATLVFQPARRRLEALADRWVFGERLGGYELLTRFGATLEQTLDPEELFPRLADTVRRGLRVRWARVSIRRPAGEGFMLDPQAAAGIEPGAEEQPAATVALRHGEESLGEIEVGPKETGDLSEEDHTLLGTLARQAALAIRNARLASDLSVSLAEIRVQAEELRASRKRLVSAGDAERRRIERNIHDGVQQELVALIANLRLARNQVAREPDAADRTLAALQDEAGLVLGDLRELARGIHPSLLSDHGLVEAIEARASRLPIPVSVHADAASRDARFADDVEGAAYFVFSEALANVLKHSGAPRATVEIGYEAEALELEVSDDGEGFDPNAVAGSGIANMSDRLEALGGSLVLHSAPGDGTRVGARLPAPLREPAHA